jgi:hypothetical protein
MKKRITSSPETQSLRAEEQWLDLETLIDVEVTSEDPEHPIESALLPMRGGSGWRAANPGPQSVRLLFHEPRALRRIRLRFLEAKEERTQEFTLRWAGIGGSTGAEIVRQQYHFSPGGSNEELEEYRVEVNAVAVLDLTITPHISGGDARASLAEFRLG